MKTKSVRLTQMQISLLVAILEGFSASAEPEQEEIDSIISELRKVESR